MRRAFTLVESLAVLTLMALIIAGGLIVWGLSREGSLRQHTKAQLHALASEIETLKVKEGNYPPPINGNQLPDKLQSADTWGNSIHYTRAADKNSFALTSPGAKLNETSDDITYDSRTE